MLKTDAYFPPLRAPNKKTLPSPVCLGDCAIRVPLTEKQHELKTKNP